MGKTGALNPVAPRRERVGLGRRGLRGRPGCGRGGPTLARAGRGPAGPTEDAPKGGRAAPSLSPASNWRKSEPAAHVITILRKGSLPERTRRARGSGRSLEPGPAEAEALEVSIECLRRPRTNWSFLINHQPDKVGVASSNIRVTAKTALKITSLPPVGKNKSSRPQIIKMIY